MKTLVLFSLAALLASTAAGEPRAGIENCEVTRPSGDYAAAVLKFTIAGMPKHPDRSKREDRTFSYAGAFRDGKMTVSDGVGLLEPGGELRLANGKLSGSFRRVDWGFEITVDGAVHDGVVSGTARMGEEEATLAGWVATEAGLRKQNSVTPELGWPASQGPAQGGCSGTWTGVATIDAPSELRLCWRSEEIDIGQGMGSISRFMNRWKDAATRKSASGAAAPIVANGKVYLKYYVPAPRPEGVEETKIPEYGLIGLTESNGLTKMLEQAKEAGYAGDKLPVYAAEKVYQNAHDIVLCMDAATGQTIWKATVADRGRNSQHHKVGPFDMTPAYGDGKVFALGMSGWLYAFDAESGEPLWETEAGFDHSNALLAVGGVVIGPAGKVWGAYDAETGEVRWQSERERSISTLSAWRDESTGKDYVIGRMGWQHAPQGIDCLDAETGERAWNLDVKVLTGGRGLGPGGITVIGQQLLVYRNNGSGVKGEANEKLPSLAAYRITATGAEPMWELTTAADGKPASEKPKEINLGPTHNESVPVVVRGKFAFTPDLRVVDLATGEVVGQTTGLQPRNGGYMQAIEDLVLVRRDGTHGNIECGWFKVAEDGSARALNPEPDRGWVPSIGGTTTSYHHPIFYPMVDGRVFFRQKGGVYCWDARKP